MAATNPFSSNLTVYFEDSLGNKDSLVLGYDPDASSQNLNPQFGEILLTAPFDSVFEVRAIHGDDGQDRTVKKVIEDVDILPWDSCALPARSKILINAKYPPIKITYDSTIFPITSCGNTILSRNKDMFFIPEWWDACGYHCMAGSSGYVEHFGPPLYLSHCVGIFIPLKRKWKVWG